MQIIITSWNEQRKKIIKLLDIMVIILLCFSFGAVVITNMLVVKENPVKEFLEASQATAKLNNYKPAPKDIALSLIRALVIKSLIWAFIISSYIYLRTVCYKKPIFHFLIFVISALFIMFGFDFFNNFGYLLGVLVY